MATSESDLVAAWDVPIKGVIHKVEFQHGTTSGKRTIRVDGVEIAHKDWMFKLVGKEEFKIGNMNCCIDIKPIRGFVYEYTMSVDGKTLESFLERQMHHQKCWLIDIAGDLARVALEKNSLDVWVNGHPVEATREFVEGGTETIFSIGKQEACIKAVSSGNKREGINYSLLVDGKLVSEVSD